MSDDSDPLDAVIEFMEDHPERFDDETVGKIRARGVVVQDLSRTGWIVVEVERHRSVFGEEWKRGKPLASFITYWERYALSPSRTELQKLRVQRQSEFHFEGGSVSEIDDYDFELEPSLMGGFQISESLTNETATVRSEEEALAFGDRLVEALSLDGIMARLDGALGPNQREMCLREVKAVLSRGMRSKVMDTWNSRESTDC